MKVSELGEFGLIEALKQIAEEQSVGGNSYTELAVGIGDDAAVWQEITGPVQIASTDMLVQGIHFTLDSISWHDLGWKSLAVNISDIAAMGGKPTHALISLGLPPNTEVEEITELYRGMAEISRKFNLAIAGGDTTESPVLTICPSIVGKMEKDCLLTRSGAQAGDRIAVTGHLGSSAAGLKIMREKLHFNLESEAIMKDAHLRPIPRVAEGLALARNGVKAAIDISDGLVADLQHVCQSSNVGAKISTGSIPVHPAVKACFGNEALSLGLAGGEDYELLFMAPGEVIEKVKQQLSIPVTIIGKLTSESPGKVFILDENGKEIDLPEKGWRHFGHHS